MFTLCWSVKGGAGTTVVAASLAVLAARRAPTTLIDLGGDSAAALGTDVPSGPGVGDWLTATSATPDRLWQLAQPCGPGLHLVPAGAMPAGAEFTDLAAERLANAASAAAHHVVIDAGPSLPGDALRRCAGRSIVVVRSCYLTLRRASLVDLGESDLVLIAEPGRALRRLDVEHALGRTVAAELPWDPAVARAVDAGLLLSRLPASVTHPLTRLVEPARRAVPR